MRKLKIFQHISLDGVIQTSRDSDFPFDDWTCSYRSAAGRDLIVATQGEGFDLLLGRNTYDLWAQYWPNAPASPMAANLNAAKKFVVTHRPEALPWKDAEPLANLDAVRSLKANGDRDLILWGSISLTSPLFAEGLVDEVVLITYPVLLGAGKRLFLAGTPPRALSLTGSHLLETGVTVNRFKVLEELKA
jgi:dihydrofolate reductase